MQVVVALVLFLMTGALVPVNRQFRSVPGGIPIYVVSNGLHTDVVLPLREPRTGHDWLQTLQQPELSVRFARHQYVAFGWGNERFYLGSMNGKFPSSGSILGAAFPSATLMHVSFYRAAPDSGSHVVPLRVSPEHYRRLLAYVRGSLAPPDSLGRYPLRQATGYGSADFFFRARGRYHLLRTCNDWTTHTLRQAGIRAPLKSPLAAPVLHHAWRSARPRARR